jgi:hypothetical protein
VKNDLLQSLFYNINLTYTSFEEDIGYLGVWLNWFLTFGETIFFETKMNSMYL